MGEVDQERSRRGASQEPRAHRTKMAEFLTEAEAEAGQERFRVGGEKCWEEPQILSDAGRVGPCLL